MQKYSKINASDKVVDALLALNDIHETLLSLNSGTAFPTSNLYVGMPCFRTDRNKIYALKTIEPLAWTLIADLNVDIYNAETLGGQKPSSYAAASHGNHVPIVETANNSRFLRNDNTWQTVTPANIKAAAASHGHTASEVGAAPKDFGLGTTATLVDGNWNDYKASGFYMGDNLINAPTQGSGHWYFIEATYHDNNWIYQQAHGFGSAPRKTYERWRHDSGWENWREIITGDQLTGQVAFFAMPTPPAGWLKANGAAVSRTTYAALFAAIGTTWGAGDGSTTFHIPDLRGEFFRGWDDGRGIDGWRAFGSVQGDAIRNITGRIRHGKTWAGSNTGCFTETYSNLNAPSGHGNENGGYTDFDASRVVPTASENRPRNIAMLACIKY